MNPTELVAIRAADLADAVEAAEGGSAPPGEGSAFDQVDTLDDLQTSEREDAVRTPGDMAVLARHIRADIARGDLTGLGTALVGIVERVKALALLP